MTLHFETLDYNLKYNYGLWFSQLSLKILFLLLTFLLIATNYIFVTFRISFKTDSGINFLLIIEIVKIKRIYCNTCSVYFIIKLVDIFYY